MFVATLSSCDDHFADFVLVIELDGLHDLDIEKPKLLLALASNDNLVPIVFCNLRLFKSGLVPWLLEVVKKVLLPVIVSQRCLPFNVIGKDLVKVER